MILPIVVLVPAAFAAAFAREPRPVVVAVTEKQKVAVA